MGTLMGAYDTPRWKVLPGPQETVAELMARCSTFVVKPGDTEPPVERVVLPVVRPSPPIRR